MKVKVFDKNFEGCEVTYPVETIAEIVHGKYRDFYSQDDIRGNDVRPNDSVMIIKFLDGTQASFGDRWTMVFGI